MVRKGLGMLGWPVNSERTLAHSSPKSSSAGSLSARNRAPLAPTQPTKMAGLAP